MSPARASAEDVLRATTPEWVDETPIPAPLTARLRQVQDGVYYLLDDIQVRAGRSEISTYRRSVVEATDRGGLESAGSLDIVFDPSSETIILNRVRIRRSGTVLDRSPSTTVRIVERESDLDSGVVDGLKTAHLEIADVRIGDIVDIAYTLRSRPQIWTGQFFDTFSVSWSVPLGLMRYRLLWPSDRPLTIRNQRTTVSPTRTAAGEQTVYDWSVRDPEPVSGEADTPRWYPRWGRVTLSSMKSWRDVVDGTTPLYANKYRLSSALEQRAQQIAKAYPRAADRITEALRFVQDELRYVSLSIGIGSYVPRDPGVAFQSGYGDCKDKSVLLVALLREMGITAYPALTHADRGRALPQVAPSPYAFDHEIVEVAYGGKTYWLDPTLSHEGGRFPDLAGLDYGWALPIAPGQTDLERIPPLAAPQPTFLTTERYDVPRDGRQPMTLRVQTDYLGLDADWMRDNIANKSLASIEQDYLDFYAKLYPGLTSAQPVKFVDDRDKNHLVVFESYTLSASKFRMNGLDHKFPIRASGVNEYNTPEGVRRMPYNVSFPINRRHTIILKTAGRQVPVPDPVFIHDPIFDYSFGSGFSWDSTGNSNSVTFEYSLVGKSDVVQPSQIPQFANDVAAMKDANYWDLDLASKPESNDAGWDAVVYSLEALTYSLL